MKTDCLTDRVAIITGASRGIGRRHREKPCAKRGKGSPCRAGRPEVKLGEIVAAIREAGNEAVAYPADLREIDAPQHLVEAAVAQFGGIDMDGGQTKTI